MPEPAEQPDQICAHVSQDRRWWVKMLVASAALAAVLFGMYFLTPVLQIRYHARQYQAWQDPDGEHLRLACQMLVSRRATEEEVRALLGSRCHNYAPNPDSNGRKCLLYPFWIGPEISKGYAMAMFGGHAVELHSYVYIDRTAGVQYAPP
jgi:hypothetical protein